MVYFDTIEPSLDDPFPAPPFVLPAECCMGISDLTRCDINHDGLCDEDDLLIFESAIGTSLGDPNFNPFADFDGDRIVTDLDRELLGFAGPVSVEDQTEVTFSGIFHNRRTEQSKVNARVTNISCCTSLCAPLALVIESISDPYVEVANPDGLLNGKPFFDLSGVIPGTELDPGESTDAITLIFSNPLLRHFSVKAVVMEGIFSGTQ